MLQKLRRPQCSREPSRRASTRGVIALTVADTTGHQAWPKSKQQPTRIPRARLRARMPSRAASEVLVRCHDGRQGAPERFRARPTTLGTGRSRSSARLAQQFRASDMQGG